MGNDHSGNATFYTNECDNADYKSSARHSISYFVGNCDSVLSFLYS